MKEKGYLKKMNSNEKGEIYIQIPILYPILIMFMT